MRLRSKVPIMIVVVACNGSGSRESVAVPVLSLNPTLLMDIAGTTSDGEVVLESVLGGTRFEDGTIAIADGLAPAVRYFDAHGTFVSTSGREGEGPGEFRMLSWLGRCDPEEVWVWDFVSLRVTVLDRRGELVRTDEWADAVRPPARLACSQTGLVATVGRPDLGSVDEGGDFVPYTAAVGLRDTLGSNDIIADSVPIIEWAVEAGNFRPLSRTTFIAVSPDAVWMTADSIGVVRHEITGGSVDTFNLAIQLRRPTRAHMEWAANEQAMWMPDADVQARLWTRLMEIPLPSHLPPFSGLHYGGAGIAWAVLSHPGDPVTILRGVRSDGEIIGDLQVQQNLMVWEVGANYVLGSYNSATTGEPHVALYEFELSF